VLLRICPDFLINAGGIITAELAHYGKEEIMSKTENIYNTTLEIIDYAVANGITTHHAALTIAQNRIDQRKIENKAK
jgi:leucine dehydrogenase